MLLSSVARTGLELFCLMLVLMACRNNFLALGIITLGASLVSGIAVLVTGCFLGNYLLKLVTFRKDNELVCSYLGIFFFY